MDRLFYEAEVRRCAEQDHAEEEDTENWAEWNVRSTKLAVEMGKQVGIMDWGGRQVVSTFDGLGAVVGDTSLGKTHSGMRRHLGSVPEETTPHDAHSARRGNVVGKPLV